MTKKVEDFTQGSILRGLVVFMLPILGALILQAAYGAVDLWVVGRFGTTAGLSGVSTGSQVLNLVILVITQFAMGLTVLIAKYLGEQRTEKIAPLIGGVTLLFSTIAVVLFVVMFFFARPLAVLLQAPAEALDLTVLYIQICGSGIFFIIAYNVLSAIFRGLGDSRSPLLFVGVACLVNVVLDIVFVAGFGLNVIGAALATVLAQMVSVCYALWLLKRRDLPFSLNKADFHFNRYLKSFATIGTPLAIQEFLTQLSFLALAAFVNQMGLEASSGYGVASKVINFAMLVPSALMQSLASFVSQNVGAKQHVRAKKALYIGIGLGLVIGLLVFVSLVFGGKTLAGFFTDEAIVAQKGYDYLLGFSAETIVTAFLFSLLGYFNGYQQSKWVMTQGLLQTFLVRLPFAYIVSRQAGASLFGMGLSAPVASLFGLLLNIIFLTMLYRSQVFMKEAPYATN